MIVLFKRIKQSGFQIKLSRKIIYTDPFKLSGEFEKADLILVSHSHFDHYHLPSIKLLIKDDTTIICPASCKKAFKLWKSTKTLKPGEDATFMGIKIRAVHAYNRNKFFHRKRKNWVGYIISDENGDDKRVNIYFAGDTDVIPEMAYFPVIHFAFIPIGGRFTMNSEEALEAIKMIKPLNVIPMHELNANLDDFAESVKKNITDFNVNVIKLKPGQSFQ